jgi:hypothetical protein
MVVNCPHQIVQRGHNRKAIFLADEDYRCYLESLGVKGMDLFLLRSKIGLSKSILWD